VPLSEHEQRLLEQMERALYAEDPKFATSLRGTDPRRHGRRRVAVASVGFALGVVLLMTGLVTTVLPVSILGFIVMLVSLLFAITSWRQANAAPDLKVVGGTPPGGDRRTGGGRKGDTRRPSGRGFMGRMEDRWNRRRDERDR
jgi:hypothetical protein